MGTEKYDFPHDIIHVTLVESKVSENSPRTLKVNMEITDSEAEFMAMVLSRLVGKIIGYRFDKRKTRVFARLVSVDQANMQITIRPITFDSQTGEKFPRFTEHHGQETTISILEIFDFVL